MKKFLIGLAALVIIGAILFFGFVATYFDKSMNTVSYSTIEENSRYDSLSFIADLHCDMLLWNRNFFGLHKYGHVDLPRMQKAGMALQVFTIVSKVPKGINIEQNDDKTDQITLLSFGQLRPPKTWFSLKARALQQCAQLHDFATRSNGDFRVITNRRELERYVLDKKNNKQLTAGMLGLEGAHCLEADVNNLQAFYDAGVRYIGITHFFDNEWGGSAHGMKKGGLTKDGISLTRKMEELGIIIDLAHASVETIDDVLRVTSRPVIVSHTGVKGECDNQRNLSDKHLQEIGKRNGLVGIGLWETAVCGTDADATARSIRYVADKIGVDKVCLGSDFDGAIRTHFDVAGLPTMVTALQKQGFSFQEIDKIMGGNIRDFMLQNLPVE
ncbi:MAG TPA: dipeptidase [Cyclobacteriaceae bacterium]|nr:dipeptidase [Cyclobacteriaceae bacterium]HRJ82064.1 dipeptidase [Cyclobacteriaceae bacterium]